MGFSLGRIISGVATGGLSEIIGSGGSSGGGGSSSSSTNDAQIGASESGIANQSGTAGRDNALTLGTNSRLNAGGVEIAGPNAGSVVIGATSAETERLVHQITSAINDQSATGGETLDTVLGQLAPLAESKQTEGVSGLSKTALWGVGIVVVGVVVWALNRK